MSLEAAVARIREASALEPRVGVILGSGLGGLADELDDRVEIPYSGDPWLAGVDGSRARRRPRARDRSTACPSRSCVGRAHLYEGIGADRVVFGVRVLGALGIRSLVVTNAAGGINTDFRPGQIVLISDHVNLQGTSALVGPNDDVAGAALPGHE